MSKINTQAEISAFLTAQGYSVKEDGSILIIRDEDGLNIFAAVDESQIEFMVDLCSINDLNTTNVEEIYEVVPVVDGAHGHAHSSEFMGSR